VGLEMAIAILAAWKTDITDWRRMPRCDIATT